MEGEKRNMKKAIAILGAVAALLLGTVSAASAGVYFVPEGLTLINGFLYQLAPVIEETGLILGEAYEPIVRETGLFVGGGY
jgi:hypothetical protein